MVRSGSRQSARLSPSRAWRWWLLGFGVLATISLVWLFLPAPHLVASTSLRHLPQPTTPAPDGSAQPLIFYVELSAATRARNFHTLFASDRLLPLTFADDSHPADPAHSFTPPPPTGDGSPLSDRVVSGVLPAAAPLLAAADLAQELVFVDHGPRLMALDPASPLVDRISPGVFITGITLHEVAASGETELTHYPTATARRVVDVLELAQPGQTVDIVTGSSRLRVDMPSAGALGLVVADYQVPESLPDVEVPEAGLNRAAGLATALGIYHELAGFDEVSAEGFAAVGGIDETGAVLAVSRPDLRARSLPDVAVIFVPVSQLDKFAAHAPAGWVERLVGVSRLSEAVARLPHLDS